MFALALALALLAVRAPPAPVPGLGPVVDLSVGREHACAVAADGAVYCWGNGAHLQLGDGRPRSQIEARARVDRERDRVRGIGPARAVAAGGTLSCALGLDGEVWCWGGYRKTADDPDGIRWPLEPGPVLVATPITGTRALAAGWVQATLLDGGGRVSIVDAYGAAVPLSAFVSTVELAAFDNGFCTRDASGAVRCETSGESGETGDGGGSEDDDMDADAAADDDADDGDADDAGDDEEVGPARVLAPVAWTAAHEAASRDREGDLQMPCVDIGDDRGVPLPALCRERLAGATDIDAGDRLACAVLADGRVACWGCADCWESDSEPPLGLGRGPFFAPRLVPGIADAVQVAVGGRHLCVRTRANVTKCWGDNFEGQLGDALLPATATPQIVAGLGDVVAIDAGTASTCALRRDGAVLCWGRPLGTPPRERPDPDADAPTAWAELPIATAEAPAEHGAVGPAVCRDVDVFVRDGDLTTVDYTYDRQRRVVLETTTEQRASGPYVHSVRYTYDRHGRVRTRKAHGTEDDTRYTYTYDALGRVLVEAPRGGEPVRWTWTRAGAIDDGQADDERAQRVERDARGRVVKERSSDPQRLEAYDVATTYDDAGRVATERTTWFTYPYFAHPFDTTETRFVYDAAGRHVRSEELRRAPDGAWLPWRTTVHLYSGGCAR